MEKNKIYFEDCLDTMEKMPDNFLDCIVTSPPYFNAAKKYQRGIWTNNKINCWRLEIVH